MVKLRTLGECVAEIGTLRLGPDAERLFAVLLCLGIEGDRLSNRAALTGLLWPDVPEERGAHSLRQAVYRLRALGAPVSSDRSNLWIAPSELDLDCAPLLGPGPEPEGFAQRLRGSFLSGYHPRFSDRYAEWLERQRDLVNARIRRAFLTEIGRLKAQGDWAGVECMAARCLALDPLNEEATLAKAEAAALQGGKSQALAILDGYLKEVGPQAREIRLPATVLRRRIAEATHLERPRAITETPFFGRAVEMARLHRSLQLAHAGTGSAHLFWGEPGIGKTRLMQEFGRALSLGHSQLVRVGCQSNDDRRPLSMFVDMLPRLMSMPGALGCSPDALRHLRRLIEHEPSEPLAATDARDAATVFATIRRSLIDLLDAVASEGLLVLIIEDVHWLDTGSWDVIADVLSWMSTRRVLLLLTAREPDGERKRGIAELPGLQRHHLPPLDRDAVEALSATIVARSGQTMSPDIAAWCAESCGGNPYHLTELVLHGLREGRTTKLPASLSQLISERLTRLDPLSLHVLQGASVLGGHSTLHRLERLLDQRRLDLLDALDELEQSGLLESEPCRLVSKHDLLSQAAVQRLSLSARRLLHRHAAVVLEEDAAGSRSPALQWACAEHWREAGEVGRALSYLEECARYALESGAPADALELLDRAASLTRDDAERARIVRERSAVLAWAGSWHSLADLLRGPEGRPLSESAHEGVHDEQELRLLETLWRSEANYSEAILPLRKCITAKDATPDHSLQAARYCLICCDNMRYVGVAQDVFADAEKRFLRSEASAEEKLRVSIVFHTAFGDVEEAVAAATRLRKFAGANQTAEMRARDLLMIGAALRTAGYEDEASATFSDALSICVSHQVHGLAAAATLNLAGLEYCRGDFSSYATWMNQSSQFATLAQDRTLEANLLGLRVRRALLDHDLDVVPGYLSELLRLAPNPPRRFALIIESSVFRYRLLSKEISPTQEALEQLSSLYSQYSNGTGSDYLAAAIYECYQQLEQPGNAEQFRQAYLKERRERSAIPPELSHRNFADKDMSQAH